MTGSWAFLGGLPAVALGVSLLALARISRRGSAPPGDGETAGSVGTRARPDFALKLSAGILAVCALVAALQLDAALRLDTDDAPITFRYAENLASGRGFVYNEGRHVNGTSTPLFTLLLAGPRLAGVPIETTALLLSVAALAALPGLLLAAGAACGSAEAGLLAAAVALTEAPFLVYSTQGMETTLFSALILAALLAHAGGRERTAAVLAGLCVVMRLDGLAVPAAIAAGTLFERRRIPRSAVLLFLLVTLPWFLFSWHTFSALAPQSLTAKLQHARLGEPTWMLLGIVRDGAVLFLPLGLLGAGRLISGRNPGRLVWPAWLAFYVAAFTWSGIDAYPWYRIPPIPVLALFAGLGLSLAAGALSRPAFLARAALPLLAIALCLASWNRAGAWRDSLAEYAEQLRVWETPRVATGEWLRDHALPASVVRTSAIGHIGWISGLEIQDSSGLVSPEALGAGFPPASADFIVGHDGDPRPGDTFRVEDPDYELVQSLAVEPAVVYRIYKRRGAGLR